MTSPQYAAYPGGAAYGSIQSMLGGKPTPVPLLRELPKRKSPLPALVGCLFVPWVYFVCLLWLRSFDIRRDAGDLVDVLSLCFLLPVAVFAWMTFNLVKTGDPKPMAFLTVATGIAWILGIVAGDYIYKSFMRPYYDINNLNVYPSVDPATHLGSQLMDAGIIEFTKDTKLALQHSIGFKNEDVYCVAPIVSAANQSNFDFWAVGVNCCSGHTTDFACGEFSNPFARSGLRLMDDSNRQMFRLAVKEAEAAFNLKTTDPIMMYWLSKPETEVNAYQNAGWQNFLFCVFGYLAVQFALLLKGIALYSSI